MASFMNYFGAGRKDPKQTARDAIVGLRQQLQMIEKKEEYLQKKIDEETKKARANAVSNKARVTILTSISFLLFTKFILNHAYARSLPVVDVDRSSAVIPCEHSTSIRVGCWCRRNNIIADALVITKMEHSLLTGNFFWRKKVSEQELDRLAGNRLQLEMQVNTLESANLNAETMAAMKKASDALKVIHGNLTMDKVDATMQQVNEQRELANEIGEVLSNPMYGSGMDLDEDELKAELEELEQDELNVRLSEADHAPVHLPPGTSKVEDKSRTPAAKVAAEDDEDAQLKELQAALAM
ncbi:Snf7-domain-containing protein [Panaeolus papilionaceus]|nr:Snf7-domain-containing protein [Panaeolus papilionaceus]